MANKLDKIEIASEHKHIQIREINDSGGYHRRVLTPDMTLADDEHRQGRDREGGPGIAQRDRDRGEQPARRDVPRRVRRRQGMRNHQRRDKAIDDCEDRHEVRRR